MAESLCVFCEQGDLGVEKVGETFQKDGVTVHENCLVNFTIDQGLLTKQDSATKSSTEAIKLQLDVIDSLSLSICT